jgi:glucose/mannose transport system substrate-binding protein
MKLSSRFVVLTLLAILLAAGTLTLLTNQHVDAQTAARLAVEMLENNPTATAQSSQTESELLTAQETADTLEIFTWWSGAGELDALSALAALYESEHPTVSVVVSSDYSILTDRLIHGTPPDSFQTHIGQELVETWVKPGYLEPIDLLWQEEDWLDKFPSELINMASYQGQVYAVPIDIHRGNVLWCNKDIFATHGLTVPTTIQEFFTVASQLQAAGIVPLALGDKYSWPATHLFETVLLGVLGPEGYNDLWTGELGFTEPNVKQAIETFGQITDYVNPNHSALDWGDAGQLLIQGEAAMLIMGDWMDGYFRANGWQPDMGASPEL